MSTNQITESGQGLKRQFSTQEQNDYCLLWEKSGLNRTKFCQINDISRSAFHRWYKNFNETRNSNEFAPLILEKNLATPKIKQENIIQLALNFPNQMQLNMAIPKDYLVSFIGELSYAATIIR